MKISETYYVWYAPYELWCHVIRQAHTNPQFNDRLFVIRHGDTPKKISEEELAQAIKETETILGFAVILDNAVDVLNPPPASERKSVWGTRLEKMRIEQQKKLNKDK
jgi:hypothetical protein